MAHVRLPHPRIVVCVRGVDDDEALCRQLSARGSPARLVIRVTTEAVYFHCAKAFLRSRLWQAGTWPEPVDVSFGNEIAARGGLDKNDIETFDAGVKSRYLTDL